MPTYIRNNAWNNSGNFQDGGGNYTDLYWYAIGVYTMQQRALNDPAGWWYFAAIHGDYVLPSTVPAPPEYPGWAFIPAPPSVPTAPLPPASQPAPFSSGPYWDQCQHYGWYFLPWHRGYLLALEAQLRTDIVAAGGPATWALPYWNYFGPNTEFNLPAAFTAPQLPPSPPGLRITLPNPAPNPLLVTARYGPDGNGTVYVPTPAGILAHPHDPNFADGPVTDPSMSVTDFVSGGTTGYGFGGDGPAQFLHFGSSMGDLEQNPHNLVHVYVGGNQNLNGPEGLMSDPGLAALDPIFYLHHANIDRMWAVWNSSNANPSDPGWTNGPQDQGFIMPMAGAGGSTAWPYTPALVAALGLPATNYTYDQMPVLPLPPSPATSLTQRLSRLGVTAAASPQMEETEIVTGTNTELVGASRGTLAVKGAGARTAVTLDPEVRDKVSASLRSASLTEPPDRVYLALENIRGTRDSSALNVYINLPQGANPNDHPDLHAGTVGLFGLRRASSQTGEHGGGGLTFTLDITKIVDQLHLSQALNTGSLDVAIIPHRPLPEQSDITIGRVSVYRKGR